MSARRLLSLLIITLLILPPLLPPIRAAKAQDPCGVVDSIDYPIDGISIDHDDFGMYRAGFGGYHSGIDMAFNRYGDPVHAAARGKVTFSDPEGWDTEKGVVIIEHTFPDDSIFFTLYGHMEEVNGRTFPPLGQCVEKGDIIGSVGNPSRGAPHLHYEIRKMKASVGGPGYNTVDPLDGGWLHPIDFTEQWQLRLNPSYRSMLTAGSGPTAPPLPQADGNIVFAEEYHLEKRSLNSETIWRLDVQGLTGIINLPDGRILGRRADDQIIITQEDRFTGNWKADRPLLSPPLRLGDSLVFLARDNRVISYDYDGKLRWQTQALGSYIEKYVQNGNLLAISAGQEKAFKLWIVDETGSIRYQASAPFPIMPFTVKDGFLVLVASQIGLLSLDMTWKPLMDVGQALGRASQVALDQQGNVALYPGQGQRVYFYSPDGALRWQAQLLTPQRQPVLLGIGSGCLVYALTADGALLAFRSTDGALRGIETLYAGGVHEHAASRFVKVSDDDQVQFSAGYLSIATIDGPTLATVDCKKGV